MGCRWACCCCLSSSHSHHKSLILYCTVLQLGSTIVLVFEAPPTFVWTLPHSHIKVRLGQSIGIHATEEANIDLIPSEDVAAVEAAIGAGDVDVDVDVEGGESDGDVEVVDADTVFPVSSMIRSRSFEDRNRFFEQHMREHSAVDPVAQLYTPFKQMRARASTADTRYFPATSTVTSTATASGGRSRGHHHPSRTSDSALFTQADDGDVMGGSGGLHKRRYTDNGYTPAGLEF